MIYMFFILFILWIWSIDMVNGIVDCYYAVLVKKMEVSLGIIKTQKMV